MNLKFWRKHRDLPIDEKGHLVKVLKEWRPWDMMNPPDLTKLGNPPFLKLIESFGPQVPREPRFEWKKPDADDEMILGVDPAEEGADRTVVSLGNGQVVVIEPLRADKQPTLSPVHPPKISESVSH